jgi:predicted GH43/DUF377 family glycosyl hydrolase
MAKPYLPGEEILNSGDSRAGLLMRRVLEIPETDVASVLGPVLDGFSTRHRGFERTLQDNFDLVAHHIPRGTHISHERRLLVGAYFTHEYSVEAAALFNPSMVLAPDQRGLPAGTHRFVMSLRAVGEGHLSSIEFRTDTVDAASRVTFDPVGPHLVTGLRTAPSAYDKGLFGAKLTELGAGNDLAWSALSRLPDQFTLDELNGVLAATEREHGGAISHETTKIIRILAASNYVTRFPADSALSERVIFPVGPNETRGMEDARFVRFLHEDGTVAFYATYTAFDGYGILPQLIETKDFVSFTIATLNGSAAQNKGMALFPRKIDGKYVMLSRKDRENLYLATSSHLRFWNDATELDKPSRPWELLHIGNCGSPIETDAGWLVLTHGVGPMRRYALGAMLLDLEDPRRVIGHLPAPLLEPDEAEREGYVPNVLYTCGALALGDTLILPYGFSDRGTHVAHVAVSELVAATDRV